MMHVLAAFFSFYSLNALKVMEELKEVRNCHASFAKGMLPGLAYTGDFTTVWLFSI